MFAIEIVQNLDNLEYLFASTIVSSFAAVYFLVTTQIWAERKMVKNPLQKFIHSESDDDP